MERAFREVTSGLGFPEGPVALANGDVLVTEIMTGQIARVAPDGSKSVFAVTGGGPNGMAVGPDGAYYVTQNGGFAWIERVGPDGVTRTYPGEKPADYIGGQIQRISPDGGTVTTLYRSCAGEPLKGPNDIVFDREGNFYFTDLGKTYGRLSDRTGVFYASPDGKMIREVIFPMERPNGIGLSPDEKTLYVAETPTGRVWAFEIKGPGEIGSRRVLATVPGKPPLNQAGCDSMCVDGDGNVLIATLTNGGITSIAPDGSVDHTPCPDPLTTNCCFGGPGLGTLFVTLSTTGRLIAFDDWPTRGLAPNFSGL